jgi:hypothetical protein
MDFQLKNNKFVITDLDYEMAQIILNGIIFQKNKMLQKISYLTICIFNDSSESEKNNFYMQIDYFKKKNEELNKISHDLNVKLESMPLIH